MAYKAILNGNTVLVVEDDFHLATCIRDLLCEAGADVLGPVGHEDQALALIDSRLPSCAIVDINLGQGARFTVADTLRARGVPFMFMTGYDDVMIPARFGDVGRMRKPSGFRLVVQAAIQMCSRQAAGRAQDAAARNYLAIAPRPPSMPAPANAVPLAAGLAPDDAWDAGAGRRLTP